MGRWQKVFLFLGIVFVTTLIGFLIWYAFWVNFVENYELGFVYDKYTGKVEVLDHNGWVVRTPWHYDVHTIDLRPNQVCMNANSRVLNCKLVRFEPKGLGTFVAWHGRAAGDRNRIYEILRSYAFNVNNGKDCPFLIVLDEMERRPVEVLAPEPPQR